MVATTLKSVALDGVGYFYWWIYPFIGYALEGFIVASYLQWRAECERVDIWTQCPLQPNNGSLAFEVNPITADFKIGGFSLHPLAHFNYHQEHSYYLIVLHSGDYVEIRLVTDNTLFCVLDFYDGAAFGAKVCAVAGLQPLVSAFHAGTHSGFQPVAIVLDGGVQRPLFLWRGERAESPVQFHNMFLS